MERYESDIEEEGGASASSHSPKKAVKGEKELMLVISERFLEERSSMGDKVNIQSTVCFMFVVSCAATFVHHSWFIYLCLHVVHG